jgi:REP-associated tyrosine transposase
MPRQARLVFPGVALHVVQRGHNRQACFGHETDSLVYLTLLHQLSMKSGCALHAYCLMTNHVHLLLTPNNSDACARLMRNLGQRYVQYFNRRYARSGTLWEGRFHSCLVDSADYVLACHRYIELNPVRAGMVTSAGAYRWSSHNGNSGRVENPLLTAHAEYLALSPHEPARRSAYRRLFDRADDPPFLDAIREATQGGFPLVGEKLKARIAASGRPVEARKPGPAPRVAPPADRLSGELGF